MALNSTLAYPTHSFLEAFLLLLIQKELLSVTGVRNVLSTGKLPLGCLPKNSGVSLLDVASLLPRP